MAGDAFEIMKRASIFMILAQTIIYFRPQESYEKYLRFLIHLMLIVVLFFPVVELVNHSAGNRMQSSLSAYMSQMEQLMDGMKDMTIEEFPQENTYISTIQEEVKIRLNNYSSQTGYIVENAEIRYAEEESQKINGSDTKIYITVKSCSEAISTIKVDKVKWKSCKVEKEEDRTLTQQELLLREQYAQILGIEEYNLEVVTDEMDR